MKPIEFKEQSKVLGRPESMTDEECSSLPVFSDGMQCVSCWKLSEEEISLINKTGCVYISVLSGQTQPPIWATVENPFIQASNKDGKWKIFIIEDDGEKTYVIAENEELAKSCYMVDISDGEIDSIREATIKEIEETKIQCEDELKMPTLIDYYLNYDGNEAQIICSTIYVD